VRVTSASSAIAVRIGPVYLTADLCRHLVTAEGRRVGAGTIRRWARQGRLVSFLTDDGRWAFPSWSLDAVDGRLVPNRAVTELWAALPAGGFLTDVDRAIWMSTSLRGLGGTPAEHAREHGPGSPPLLAALSRLRARAG
jgi:hypothetical protein